MYSKRLWPIQISITRASELDTGSATAYKFIRLRRLLLPSDESSEMVKKGDLAKAQ
jgi:hypothetical protein